MLLVVVSKSETAVSRMHDGLLNFLQGPWRRRRELGFGIRRHGLSSLCDTTWLRVHDGLSTRAHGLSLEMVGGGAAVVQSPGVLLGGTVILELETATHLCCRPLRRPWGRRSVARSACS